MSSLTRRVERSPHHRAERKKWGRSFKRAQKAMITEAERGGADRPKPGALKSASLAVAAAWSRLFGSK